MMPVIRIGDDNMARLKRFAEPLEDSADDALGKVLTLAEKYVRASSGRQEISPSSERPISVSGFDSSDKRPHPTNAELSSDERGAGDPLKTVYYEAIGMSLVDLGGCAQSSQVLAKVEPRVRAHLTPRHYENDGKSLRWQHLAHSTRVGMVRDGLLRPTSESGRGYWELTQLGRETFQ